MKRENERQIKKNLSKILGVLVLCLIMPLLFSISAEAKEAEESQQQEKVQQTERINEINTFEDFFIFAMASQTLDYEGHRVVLKSSCLHRFYHSTKSAISKFCGETCDDHFFFYIVHDTA
jgi:hypothetical protein